jgi:hypothetical protein
MTSALNPARKSVGLTLPGSARNVKNGIGASRHSSLQDFYTFLSLHLPWKAIAHPVNPMSSPIGHPGPQTTRLRTVP